jgi:hypothetical protein
MQSLLLAAVAFVANPQALDPAQCARVGQIINQVVAQELGQGQAHIQIRCGPRQGFPVQSAGLVGIPESSLPAPLPEPSTLIEKERIYKKSEEWTERKRIFRQDSPSPVYRPGPSVSPYGRGYRNPVDPRFLPENRPWAPKPYLPPNCDSCGEEF